MPLAVNVLLLRWIRSLQEIQFCSTIRGVLHGKVLPAVVNSIPSYTRSHSLTWKEVATPTAVTHRNLAFIAMNCALPRILKIRVGKKESKLRRSAWRLASRLSLCLHFSSMILTLKHWRMAFIMRKKLPCTLNVSVYVSAIWVLRNNFFFPLKGKKLS